jgi:hypothetical protein
MNQIQELVPSQEGLKLIEDRVPNADLYLGVARTGSHRLNPYHNLTHELSVAYWAYSCWVNSERPYDPSTISPTAIKDLKLYAVPRLLTSALFHDHNHSGGRTSDKENVDRARQILLQIGTERLETDFGRGWSELDRCIACTEFTNGKFPIEPQSFAAKCIRDADLMSIYSEEGRHLLIGLLKEMNIPVRNEDDVMNVMNRQRAFLTEAHMYTQFGQFMRQHYLEEALSAFNQLLTASLPKEQKSIPLKMWCAAAGISIDELLKDINLSK